MENASTRDLDALRSTSIAMRALSGQEAIDAWTRELALVIGPGDLMRALYVVTFQSSHVDLTLGAYTHTMHALIRSTPECMATLCQDPLKHVRQCTHALQRQLQSHERQPLAPVSVKWARNMHIWDNLFYLCLYGVPMFRIWRETYVASRLPYRDLDQLSSADIDEFARLLFAFQSQEITLTLDILDQKATQLLLNPTAIEGVLSSQYALLR